MTTEAVDSGSEAARTFTDDKLAAVLQRRRLRSEGEGSAHCFIRPARQQSPESPERAAGASPREDISSCEGAAWKAKSLDSSVPQAAAAADVAAGTAMQAESHFSMDADDAEDGLLAPGASSSSDDEARVPAEAVEEEVDKIQYEWQFDIMNSLPHDKAVALMNLLKEGAHASAAKEQLKREVMQLRRNSEIDLIAPPSPRSAALGSADQHVTEESSPGSSSKNAPHREEDTTNAEDDGLDHSPDSDADSLESKESEKRRLPWLSFLVGSVLLIGLFAAVALHFGMEATQSLASTTSSTTAHSDAADLLASARSLHSRIAKSGTDQAPAQTQLEEVAQAGQAANLSQADTQVEVDEAGALRQVTKQEAKVEEQQSAVEVQYKVLGSYKDKLERALRFGPHALGYNFSTCMAACSGHKYFALQNWGWCSCEDDIKHVTQYGRARDCGPIGGFWCNFVYVQAGNESDAASMAAIAASASGVASPFSAVLVGNINLSPHDASLVKDHNAALDATSELGAVLATFPQLKKAYRLGRVFFEEGSLPRGRRAIMTITLILGNDGSYRWPVSTRLRLVTGPDLGLIQLPFHEGVLPGTHVELTLQFEVPRADAGKETYLRSAWVLEADGSPFGPLLLMEVVGV